MRIITPSAGAKSERGMLKEVPGKLRASQEKS